MKLTERPILNKELKRDFRAGHIALKNDGSFEDLTKVIKETFPESKKEIEGNHLYYYGSFYGKYDYDWFGADDYYLPKVSISEFFKPETRKV